MNNETDVMDMPGVETKPTTQLTVIANKINQGLEAFEKR